MVINYKDPRKIDPTVVDRTRDSTFNDQNRVEIGSTRLAFDEWQA